MKKDIFISDLSKVLENNSNSENAIAMEAYMRNKFTFYGIKAKDRKALSAFFLRKENRPLLIDLEDVVLNMWDDPHREVQFIAMELVDKYKNEITAQYFQLIEKMITRKSWWDTVDFIASNLLGNLVKKYPKEGYEIIEKWRYSGNLWLLRSCIIFQLKYKDTLDEELLFSLIKENSSDKEFFIRKAIGWALRQYAKTKPDRVLWFVRHNELSPLSRREALKHL